MRLPDHVFATLTAERAKYGPAPNEIELGLLLNCVAWAHWTEGYGLSRKVGGATAPFPGGGTIAQDILMLRDGTAWDVLYAAGGGGPARPVQGESLGIITDPARGWVAPVNPGTQSEPPAPSSDLAKRVADLEAKLTALEATALRDGDAVNIGTVHGRNLRATDAGGIVLQHASGELHVIPWIVDQDDPPSAGWENLTLTRVME